jgi:hypothetical protein
VTTQRALFDDPLLPFQGGPASPVEPQPKSVKTGEQLKREGQQSAAAKRANELGYARELALDIAQSRPDRTCSMVLVNEALAAEGRPGLGNAAGSVFLTSVWEKTGGEDVDRRPHAHTNKVQVWRLKHGG